MAKPLFHVQEMFSFLKYNDSVNSSVCICCRAPHAVMPSAFIFTDTQDSGLISCLSVCLSLSESEGMKVTGKRVEDPCLHT